MKDGGFSWILGISNLGPPDSQWNIAKPNCVRATGNARLIQDSMFRKP